MLELTNNKSRERDCGNNFDSVCINFTKAFDTVPHKQLIYKLSQYGIARFLLQWIHSDITLPQFFLINRNLEEVNEFKLLGLFVRNNLRWTFYILAV